MQLSYRSRQDFYHQLGQLLRAGVAFPKAIQTLQSSGTSRKITTPLLGAIGRGETVGSAFAHHPFVLPLEASVLTACDRSGRMEHACNYLSAYFEKLQRMRSSILRKLAYPLFTLHFGVFMLALPSVIFGDIGSYLKQTLGFLAGLYMLCGALWVFFSSISKAGANVAALDRILRLLPVVGPLRRALAMSRFCDSYDLLLDAGVNVMDSLQGAANSSQSALVRKAVSRALPEVRAGHQVGPLLAKSGAFPARMMRAFCIAEETGGLDKELRTMSSELGEEIDRRFETVTDWTPKVIGIIIMLYVAYQIVGSYQKSTQQLYKSLDLF